MTALGCRRTGPVFGGIGFCYNQHERTKRYGALSGVLSSCWGGGHSREEVCPSHADLLVTRESGQCVSNEAMMRLG